MNHGNTLTFLGLDFNSVSRQKLNLKMPPIDVLMKISQSHRVVYLMLTSILDYFYNQNMFKPDLKELIISC